MATLNLQPPIMFYIPNTHSDASPCISNSSYLLHVQCTIAVSSTLTFVRRTFCSGGRCKRLQAQDRALNTLALLCPCNSFNAIFFRCVFVTVLVPSSFAGLLEHFFRYCGVALVDLGNCVHFEFVAIFAQLFFVTFYHALPSLTLCNNLQACCVLSPIRGVRRADPWISRP